MRPTGTIYRSKANNIHGETRISLTRRERKRYSGRRQSGSLMAAISIVALFVFYGPSSQSDIDYIHSQLVHWAQSEITTDVVAADIPAEPVIETTSEDPIVVEQFGLEIPSIEAKSDVIAYVDPFVKDDYLAALQDGIAHASTSMLPGQGGRVYLFAHSTNSPLNFTQFNAIFYQLRLLEEGDSIVATLNGEEHTYQVTEKHIVEADDTHWITEKGDSEELVLQTCDPPGTSLRRLLIVAKPV